ncbi:MAG TPA: tagatose-bisphosphate aldolase, partial [Clostridiales bacterium]|nr:tagatose-bisphosphate aldolase [Clostridiales bacterium]
TDPDNWASRKTCLGLGCTLERTVAVPQEIRDRWEISAVKCRYIWRIDG